MPNGGLEEKAAGSSTAEELAQILTGGAAQDDTDAAEAASAAAEAEDKSDKEEGPDSPRVGEKAEARIKQLLGENKAKDETIKELLARVTALEESDASRIAEEGKFKGFEGEIDKWLPYARDQRELDYVRKMINHPDDEQRWDDRDLALQQEKVARSRAEEAAQKANARAEELFTAREIEKIEIEFERSVKAVLADVTVPEEVLWSFLDRNPEAGEAELREFAKSIDAQFREKYGVKAESAEGSQVRMIRAGGAGAATQEGAVAGGPIDGKAATRERHEALKAIAFPGSPGM